MAASSTTLAVSNASNALYQAWTQFIHNGILAGAWTEVYSSGDLAVATAPAQNTFGNTKIYRSPVEGSLTRPYLKLRFGTSNGTGGPPAIEYSFGWAWTSGANLDGLISTAQSSLANTSGPGDATVRTCRIAVNAAEIMLNLGANTANQVGKFMLALGRERDTSLAKTDSLIIHGQHSIDGTVNYRHIVLTPTKLYPIRTSQTEAVINTSSLEAVQDGEVGLCYYSGYRGRRTSPLEAFIGVEAGKLGAEGDTIVLPIYGVNRTYKIGIAFANGVGTWAGAVAQNALYLYE